MCLLSVWTFFFSFCNVCLYAKRCIHSSHAKKGGHVTNKLDMHKIPIKLFRIFFYSRYGERSQFYILLTFFVESNGRRVRGRDAVEPDWLINYKKKQKERRDSQERNQAFVFQQSIESSSYSRPIVPKLSGGAYTVALPSGSSPSDRGQVAWVTITSSQSTWKALTPTQVVEDACERDNTLLAGNMPSVRSAPTIRYV